ncbi:MAG: hypothetical protein E6L00_00390 [Thaumarchaeota archaeon]|nr:MAG: hypothetical protein E6L00_00390 [Nitrososphaerota archaeon]
MTIETDKPSYQSGDTVTVTLHPDVGTLAAVQIIAPDGKTTILSRTVPVGTGGDGSLQFKIGNTYTSGTYNIIATSTDGKTTVKCSASFSVTGGSFTIISVTPSDQQGNPVTSFTKGGLGYVKAVVSSSSSVSALVSVNLFGPDSTSLGIGSVKSTVNGNSEMVISFFIPDSAQSGTANIYTDGLSDWPSQGGVPLTTENQSTVNIG